MRDYRAVDCPNCGRNRVELDGVCDKCFWDADGGDFASITRPTQYDVQGYTFARRDENPILGQGLERTVEIQRQINQLDSLMHRQIRLSASEDPLERIRQINQTKREFAKRVDELLSDTSHK
jgi:hypothetical protein